jgi:integrase
MKRDYHKTKFPGIYYTVDNTTKVKTYIARIKVAGLIDTEQIVGYSNDNIRTNPSIAHQKRTELIQEIKSGTFNSRKLSLRKLFDDYILHVKTIQKKSTVDTKIYYFNKHFRKLEKKLIADITTNDIQKFVNQLIENGYKPQTAKHLRNLIKAVFNYGIKKLYVNNNPAVRVEIPKFNNERKFYLSEEHSKALYNEILAISDHQYRLMFLFLLRGRRKGEVLSLEWQDVNFKDKYYIIRDTNSKISETQKYLLDDELIAHFKHLNPSKQGLIFKSYRTGKKMSDFPRYTWREIKKKLGLDMRLHDFRHLLGFTLVNNNISLEIISKTLGHKSIKTTQRYSNMKEEMAKVGSDTFLKILKQ